MKRYHYFFGYATPWGWAWDDMDSETLVIEAENETAALDYGNKIATCLVTHCWPELPDQQIKGRIENVPDSKDELFFKAPEIPTWVVWQEWEKNRYDDSFDTRISGAQPTKFSWQGLKRDAFTIASRWIPHREREIICLMDSKQHFILSVFCLKSFQDENGNDPAPSLPLLELLQTIADKGEDHFSPALLQDMYREHWMALYPEILEKLRRWKFGVSVYVHAKTEELLRRIDKLLREIVEAQPTTSSALAIWEMTQRFQDWELNPADAFKNSGIIFFPLIAKKDDGSRQWMHWAIHLTPPSAWKISLLNSLESIPGELWVGAAVMSMVAIYAVILYFLPTRWQWPAFALLVLATVAIAIFLWQKRHKPEKKIFKRLNLLMTLSCIVFALSFSFIVAGIASFSDVEHRQPAYTTAIAQRARWIERIRGEIPWYVSLSLDGLMFIASGSGILYSRQKAKKSRKPRPPTQR